MNPLPDSAELDSLLGQRRAFAAVAGRCSAAHAQLLRHIRDHKLYRPFATSWEAYCASSLAITRRHADRLIALLNRFGPTYFELSELVGLTAGEYLSIEPAVREHSLLVNGEAVSLIPENTPQLIEAVGQVLRQSRRRPSPAQTLRTRVDRLAARARAVAGQLTALYNSSHSPRDREFILETATEIRMSFMQIGPE